MTDDNCKWTGLDENEYDLDGEPDFKDKNEPDRKWTMSMIDGIRSDDNAVLICAVANDQSRKHWSLLTVHV